MKIETKLVYSSVESVKFENVAILLEEGFKSSSFATIAKATDSDIASFLKEVSFTGSAGSCAIMPIVENKKVKHLFFVGLGKKQNAILDIETYRRALGTLIATVQSKKVASLVIAVPAAKSFKVAVDYLVQQTVVMMHIAGYKYDEFITQGDKKLKDLTVTLCVDKADKKDADKGYAAGLVIAQAVNTDRDWVNCPPSRLTPTMLADHAQKLAKQHGLTCTVFDEKKVTELGMEGLAGVSKGSFEECRFVILEYKAKKAKAGRIGFVGKGITFDSGGLSLKPAASMETMKEDMAGAASVINAMVALAQLKPDVDVVACVALTENLPGNRATKPGDVLKFYNGKTAEVRNTDAEGRLVLADALAYITMNYKLDAVIDLATLTGACIYAVGPFFSALLSDNDDFAEKVQAAANTSGDAVWRLPFTSDFRQAIKSDIADIQNIGNKAIAAGTITAAWFLREFVENDTPWVHLDIASTTFNVPNISYYRNGATGASVRLLVDLAMQWK